VDPLFPFIQVPPPASHGASATAAFYKALETGIPNNGRRVKIDFSQSASPHERGRMARQNMNDGTRDIGSAPAPVLLFRGLDPLSGPQAIAQAMLSSSGPGKPGAKGMKRIILIKDKVTLASFGFAFVEFIDVQVRYKAHSIQFYIDNLLVCFSCFGFHYVFTDTPIWLPHIR
jgi:RNA-binding protein 5/10